MTKKACIIGAGSSGLVTAKILQENNVAFDWFELGSNIGGNWCYDNDNGHSAAYDSLHIDTSKDRMAFSDFPMPEAFPNYLHHSQVIEYLKSYAKHFGLDSRVTFKTRVEHVKPLADGRYQVSIRKLVSGDQKTLIYNAVLVCNGHHWQPRIPDIPGCFSGELFHSSKYRNPASLKNKNVLVLGVGNSGVDIATDVAPIAARTFLASRRGAHVIPRHLLGRPTDKWSTPLFSRIPFCFQQILFSIVVWLSRGRQSKYGMPSPSNKLLTEHPTLSSELLPLVSAGKIIPKPAIKCLNDSEIIFVDGSCEKIDVFICATGYQICFPFFDSGFISTANNQVGLYGKVIHPEYTGLYFIGLIQPLGAIMPLAELQAKWAAGLITGQLVLPERDTMMAAVINDQAAIAGRYVPSIRHTIQVDFYPYKRWLKKQQLVEKSLL